MNSIKVFFAIFVLSTPPEILEFQSGVIKVEGVCNQTKPDGTCDHATEIATSVSGVSTDSTHHHRHHHQRSSTINIIDQPKWDFRWYGDIEEGTKMKFCIEISSQMMDVDVSDIEIDSDDSSSKEAPDHLTQCILPSTPKAGTKNGDNHNGQSPKILFRCPPTSIVKHTSKENNANEVNMKEKRPEADNITDSQRSANEASPDTNAPISTNSGEKNENENSVNKNDTETDEFPGFYVASNDDPNKVTIISETCAVIGDVPVSENFVAAMDDGVAKNVVEEKVDDGVSSKPADESGNSNSDRHRETIKNSRDVPDDERGNSKEKDDGEIPTTSPSAETPSQMKPNGEADEHTEIRNSRDAPAVAQSTDEPHSTDKFVIDSSAEQKHDETGKSTTAHSDTIQPVSEQSHEGEHTGSAIPEDDDAILRPNRVVHREKPAEMESDLTDKSQANNEHHSKPGDEIPHGENVLKVGGLGGESAETAHANASPIQSHSDALTDEKHDADNRGTSKEQSQMTDENNDSPNQPGESPNADDPDQTEEKKKGLFRRGLGLVGRAMK